jgi:hypothetical protein
MGPKAVPILLKRVAKQPLYTRVYAQLPIEVQCVIPTPDLGGFLLRNRTVHAISLIGPAAVPQLTSALAHPDGDVRQVALRSLAFIGPESDPAASSVAKLLKDPDGRVRMSAAMALRHMGPNRRTAIPALIDALQDDANSGDIAGEIAAVLGTIGPEAKVAAIELNDLLGDPGAGSRPREQAAVALWRIERNTNAMAFLLTKLENCRKNWKKNPASHPRFGLVEPARPIPDRDWTEEPETNPVPDGPTVEREGFFNADDFPTCLRILHDLSEMGALAKPSVPILVSLIENPDFHPSVAVLRPRFIKAAREALGRIDPETAAAIDARTL